MAFLVPAGLLRDAGSARLRHHLLDEAAWEEVWELDSGGALFPSAHRNLPICAVFIRRGGPTRRIRLPGGVLGREALERLSPQDLAIPRLCRSGDLALLDRLLGCPPLESQVHGIRKGDFNLGSDRHLFTTAPAAHALRTGKEIAPYRIPGGPGRWVSVAPASRHHEHPRVAWRDIADVTLRKRMVAAPLPAGDVLGDTLNFLVPPYGPEEAAYWLAVLNSHAFEWTVRLRSAHNHLGRRTVGPCPAPLFVAGDPECARISAAAREAESDPGAASRADALVARRYGLDAAALEHLLGAFPKQPEELLDAIRAQFSADRGRAPTRV